VVGDPDIFAPFDGTEHVGAIGVDGEHSTGVGIVSHRCRIAHGTPASQGQSEEIIFLEAAGSAERHKFTIAVPPDHIRFNAERGHETEQCQATDPYRGLCDLGRFQFLGRSAPLLVIKRWRREDELAQSAWITAGQDRVGSLETCRHFGKLDSQLSQHVSVLSALTWEHEHKRRSSPELEMAVIDSQLGPGRSFTLESIGRGRKFFLQFRNTGSDNRDPRAGLRHPVAPIECVGHVGQLQIGARRNGLL
jgi:hypothetical protein